MEFDRIKKTYRVYMLQDNTGLHAVDCVFDPRAPVLKQQFLYTVYVHSSLMEFTDFPADSMFAGTLVKNLTRAEWGDTSPAVQSLLKAALQARVLSGHSLRLEIKAVQACTSETKG